MPSRIEYLFDEQGRPGETWNPVRGCDRRKLSAGCKNCWSERQGIRLSGPGRAYEGLVESTPHGPRWTGRTRLDPKTLAQPLHWKRPRRIAVVLGGDLFADSVPDVEIAAVFGVMAACPQHTFLVLTKRASRLRWWFAWAASHHISARDICDTARAGIVGVLDGPQPSAWPLPNVLLGVSVEDQKTADERIPLLLQTPAALRWISAEPLLGPVDLGEAGAMPERPDGSGEIAIQGVDLVVAGGESGPKARPCDLAWLRDIVETCKAAQVAAYVKQLGALPVEAVRPDWRLPAQLQHPKGADPSEFPEDLRVRQWPEVPTR